MRADTRIRICAAKLLDDMCANMELIKSFDQYDVDEVAISLQAILEDAGIVSLPSEEQ